MLRLFRLITTMDALAPLPSLADQKPTWASAPTLARSWRLNQLIDPLGREGLTVVARNVANGRSGHSDEPKEGGCDWINRQKNGRL
jgi:hypothetical protein